MVICSLLLGIPENHCEANENVNRVKIDADTVRDWIVYLHRFGTLKNHLCIVKHEAREQNKATVQPDVVKGC